MSDELDSPRKPRDDEIDVFGLTHRGKVREKNEDHFLVCQLYRQIDVSFTSLPDTEIMPAGSERLATVAMVADGVGGGPGGEKASRMAIATLTRYVSESIHAYYATDSDNHDSFSGALYASALRVHDEVLAAGEADSSRAGMATTLTLFIAVWPHVYLLQVGDSRHYVLREKSLIQITRDQTVGQELLDAGVIEDRQAARLPWSDVLSSAMGGQESAPAVTRIASDWNDVHLVCSDGLTRHVSDERIQERLLSMTSAKQVCEDLLQDALDDGGTDNITMIIGRTVPQSRD